MFWRLVYQSFRRQRRRKLLAGAAITFGVAVATAMIAVAINVGDKMNRELRSFGANIIVYPQDDALNVQVGDLTLQPARGSARLREADLPKIKGIFWRHNILGFAPFLSVPAHLGKSEVAGEGTRPIEVIGTYFNKTLRFGADSFTTGVQTTHPWWRVQGTFPADEKTPGAAGDTSEVLMGAQLAGEAHIQVGDAVRLDGRKARVSGILSTGGAEDHAVVAPLSLAQEISGEPGAVERIYVSALTKPEDSFARRDPASMSPAMRDRWYCSPYANSIAFQLAEVIPNSRAEQVRQVAQSEGVVLERIRGLMLLVTLAALFSAGLAVSAAMATAVLERRREVGLMKALGAGAAPVAALFLAEAMLLALVSGLIGFVFGSLLARQIGRAVFGDSIPIQPWLVPIILLLAMAVVAAGSAGALRRAMRVNPGIVLRGDA
jgi:putative ABC transport system permease protein